MELLSVALFAIFMTVGMNSGSTAASDIFLGAQSPSPLSFPIKGEEVFTLGLNSPLPLRERDKGEGLLPGNPPSVTATSPSEHDRDGDGIMDIYDNCPTTANPDQLNSNGGPFGDACVAPDVGIPAGAKIGDYPVIGRASRLDRGILIGHNVTMGAYVILERDTIVGHNAIIGDGTVVHRNATIGNRVVLGPNVTIGSGAIVGAGSAVGTDAAIGAGASIGEGAIIGENASVLPGVAVPAGAVVPQGATVTGQTFTDRRPQ
ncbi:MAG: thrombospondin type 3 repeat-containing protein [Candidatus Binatia bacterium]